MTTARIQAALTPTRRYSNDDADNRQAGATPAPCWRLRSLVAMGHDATRIARAIDAPPEAIRAVIRGGTARHPRVPA